MYMCCLSQLPHSLMVLFVNYFDHVPEGAMCALLPLDIIHCTNWLFSPLVTKLDYRRAEEWISQDIVNSNKNMKEHYLLFAIPIHLFILSAPQKLTSENKRIKLKDVIYFPDVYTYGRRTSNFQSKAKSFPPSGQSCT